MWFSSSLLTNWTIAVGGVRGITCIGDFVRHLFSGIEEEYDGEDGKGQSVFIYFVLPRTARKRWQRKRTKIDVPTLLMIFFPCEPEYKLHCEKSRGGYLKTIEQFFWRIFFTVQHVIKSHVQLLNAKQIEEVSKGEGGGGGGGNSVYTTTTKSSPLDCTFCRVPAVLVMIHPRWRRFGLKLIASPLRLDLELVRRKGGRKNSADGVGGCCAGGRQEY